MFKRRKGQGATATSGDLLGCWHLILTGKPTEEPAEAEFRDDGTLVYSVETNDRWQIMRLTYRVDGDFLVTNQPSAPREERTRYAISAQDILELEFGGERSQYSRGPKRAPTV